MVAVVAVVAGVAGALVPTELKGAPDPEHDVETLHRVTVAGLVPWTVALHLSVLGPGARLVVVVLVRLLARLVVVAVFGSRWLAVIVLLVRIFGEGAEHDLLARENGVGVE